MAESFLTSLFLCSSGVMRYKDAGKQASDALKKAPSHCINLKWNSGQEASSACGQPRVSPQARLNGPPVHCQEGSLSTGAGLSPEQRLVCPHPQKIKGGGSVWSFGSWSLLLVSAASISLNRIRPVYTTVEGGHWGAKGNAGSGRSTRQETLPAR